jgi:N-methylhydantoinase A
MARLRLGVDVGGTFTDLVAVSEGRIVTAKVPSTPSDQSEGVLAAVEASGLDLRGCDLRHGTTVATNALLERKGARTGLLTTEGFRDVIEIGRQNRPSLYDLARDRPPPLVPRELRFAVRERMGLDGSIEPLDEESVRHAAEQLGEVDAVAICLLFAYLYPEHERRVGELVREALPGAHVSLSSEVLPEFREYERFATTVADAYLGPVLGAYLRRLEERLGEEVLVMQSSGGVLPLAEAAGHAAAAVLSGPAGGAVGAAFVARACGYEDALTLDMGGTSTDVALVVGGEVATTTETVVGGVPIRLPAVDVHSVSAGGGSIAWLDEGGAVRVGPRSAGADPGPAAYGLGGSEPTVTDANLVLGHLPDEARLGGRIELRRDLAEEALARAGLDAEGVVRVANAEMARALRVMSVERGVDPRGLALVAFGGAGPMHACALADDLGIGTVLVPRASGVLSALGLAISDVRRDSLRAVHKPVGDLAEGDFSSLGGGERSADLRYRGQAAELTVPADDLGVIADRFHEAHERRHGYRMEDEPVEVVNVRVAAIVPTEKPELEAEPGEPIDGPAVVALPEATLVVAEGWRAAPHTTGTLVLER